MNIIKLDAIPSTNDFLKGLLTNQYVENFTVVTAENQTSGRGQMGAKWEVESSKNLTFSILVRDLLLEIQSIFHLNVMVAVSLFEALEVLGVNDVAIKWPNDILSGNKKLAGILIENSFKSSGEILSVIGIGLNVNQKDFTNLPRATSLYNLMGTEFKKEEVLDIVLDRLQQNVVMLKNMEHEKLWKMYTNALFKKGIPVPFENASGVRFMGIIQGVSATGKLEVLLEDDTIGQYDIKEIQMLY